MPALSGVSCEFGILGRIMLTKLCICDGKLVECDPSGSQTPIVHVYRAPDEAEKKYLVEQLKIDEHTLNSSLDPDELSRLEFEPEHVAMIFKRPRRYNPEERLTFTLASTGLFLFKDRLVIVLADDAQLFEGRPFIKMQSPQDVCLKLIYRAILHFLEHVRGIKMISTELEQQINTSMENKHLLHLVSLENTLVYYLNAVNSNAALIEKLRNNAAKIGFGPENIEFLDDVMIENSQCRGQIEIYSQVLAGLMDARASIISNNLNIRIKTLTLITIAIMLPTLVVSLFSINVDEIPGAHHPWGFWMVMAFAAFSALGIVLLWWKQRW
jgi:magnesium transporter